MNQDSWATRLHRSIRNYLPWPHMFKCTPPLAHKPLDTDDEIQFYSDMRYLEELRDALLDDCRLAKNEAPDIFASYVAEPLLEACCVPVESAKFWEEWNWPADYAASLLSLWRMDRELEAWIDMRDVDEQVA